MGADCGTETGVLQMRREAKTKRDFSLRRPTLSGRTGIFDRRSEGERKRWPASFEMTGGWANGSGWPTLGAVRGIRVAILVLGDRKAVNAGFARVGVFSSLFLGEENLG